MVTEQKLYGILARSRTFSITVWVCSIVQGRKQYPNIVLRSPPAHVTSGMWAVLPPELYHGGNYVFVRWPFLANIVLYN